MPKRALLIAEKPSLMRDVKAVYDKYGHADNIEFASFVGHVVSLEEPDAYCKEWASRDVSVLPMIPSKFKCKPIESSKDVFNKLVDRIKKGNYDYLINCCDPAREGNLIFHNFYTLINCKLPVMRVWHNDTTENELRRALNNLRDDLNDPFLINLTASAHLRAEFDWLIGMNFSRAFSYVLKTNAPVGRVMTPVLKIVADREKEITTFKPKDFWEVEGEFKTGNSVYKGIYFNDDGETQFFDKKEAEKIIKSLSSKAEVTKLEEKNDIRYAPNLYSLALLQNEANETFGYTMAKTLEITQALYEKKLLSYPRTDSAFITKGIAKDFMKVLNPIKSIATLKPYVSKIMSNSSLLSSMVNNTKYVNDKKVSDHYAIIPTGNTPDYSKLSNDEVNIYTLVCKRLLSIFMPPAKFKKTTVITTSNKLNFKSFGSVVIDLGYLNLYSTNSKEVILPALKKGQIVDVNSTNLLTKTTKPPVRYNDSTLNSSLENAGKFVTEAEFKDVLKEAKGIGTPATRGGILEKLVAKKMVERTGSGKIKYFKATDYGLSIIDALGVISITSPKLTAEWEEKLRNIENNTYSPNDFYKEMVEYIKNTTNEFKSLSSTIKPIGNFANAKSVGTCPKCGKKLIEGKKGFGCSGYRDGCTFVIWKNAFGSNFTVSLLKTLLSGKSTHELTCKKKDGTVYKAKFKLNDKFELTFSNDKTNSTPPPANANTNTNTNTNTAPSSDIGNCPKCGKPIIEGKKGFGCSGYKTGCDFVIWKESFGATFSKTSAKNLLSGKATSQLTCKKNDGTKSKCKFKLDKNNKVVIA